MKSYLRVIFVVISCHYISAQSIVNDTITREASIVYSIKGNKVSFNPETPELNQIAGAPKAFYTYYWEFGDGNYSFKKDPVHVYKDEGNYTAKLSVTNNYDDGKPPSTRPKDISITTINQNIDSNQNHNLITDHNGFRLQTNREPMPEEEMQFIVSYANNRDYATSGTLYLFFNEKKYKDKNFDLVDVRLHNNEQEIFKKIVVDNSRYISKNELIQTTGISTFLDDKLFVTDTLKQNLPLTLEEAKLSYQDVKEYDFNEMQANEERNMFFTFKTTPEMLKDTSAVISIRSIYVPESGNDAHKVLTKEMEIVTSHDPNKMAVYDTRLNYRLVRYKKLKYKVRFQNDGEGPARLIKLNVDIPKMLDKSTLEVLDMYPKCKICPEEDVRYSCLDTIISKDQISFQFKNIYLPGTAQKGVYDKDSTKGFVKYALKFGKDFHKVTSKSKTAIIFDKNEPIITNTSTSRFKPGISIGVKAGYNRFPDLKDSESYFVGATISPYKSYKKYFQAEIMISTHEFLDFESISEQVGTLEIPGAIVDSAIKFEESSLTNNKLNVDVVPVSFRYNLNGIIGLGIGPQISLDVSNEVETTTSIEYFTYFNNRVGKHIEGASSTTTTVENKPFTDIKYGIFGDITIGASRIGPSLGARYIYNFKEPNAQLHFYAIWKI
ncbi:MULTISPECIES: PKD domain-containing protein [Flavobacteriaceae]|uniref:PKD domain-containing protein n=2 Tax=Flavobacteriaceae TaxID=49546 RepID=A0A4Y8APK4_9FLAO|nr:MULTISPECIES: PKD domain-containing protein [Flavobacteriaceae]TEW72550.1 PKD domain-containing protein [Gramella jeungdoensis]